MIQLTEIKKLFVTRAAQSNRLAHLSAASGLVQVGSWLYVIADDELHLGKFLLEGNTAGEFYRCFAGELPIDHDSRKAEKPDIEVLMLIPQLNKNSPKSLLALGSGSKINRHQGAIIPLNQQGNITAVAKIIDFSYFYEFLKREIGQLNIEGAAISQGNVVLFQRGNKKNKLNASVRLALDDFYHLLAQPQKHYQPKIHITPYDLGEVGQIPFCFTDATALPGGEIIFTGSAEDTSDAYLDGSCLGSVIGMINLQGNLTLLDPVDKKVKLEGISTKISDRTSDNNIIEILLVSDADDALQPAQLYSTKINL